MFFNRSAQLEVKEGMVKKPDDLGMVMTISYNENKFAAILNDFDMHFELEFWKNDTPEGVVMNYFDIDFCNRNKGFLLYSGRYLSNGLLEAFSHEPNPYECYLEWRPEEPKLTKQDFNMIIDKFKKKQTKNKKTL